MVKISLILLVIGLLFVGCKGSFTQPEKATKILTRDGYGNVEIKGYSWFGCSEDDWFRTKFTAEKNFVKVEGVVCSGLFKGSTIRTF